MGNNTSNYYGLFFQGGDPQNMNESVLQYPGQLGLVADVQCKDGITRDTFQAFIKGLAIPDAEKKRLLALTPATYIGKAAELAKRI